MTAEARRSPKTKGLIVRELEPAEYPLWRELVESSPSGSAYSLPEYLEALSGSAGGRAYVLAALRGETVAGGIAVYERPSPAGAFVSPRLLLYYNGVVLREYETRYPSERAARQLEIVTDLVTALEAKKYGRLELRSRSPIEDLRPVLSRGWRVEPSYSYVVPLGDVELLWGSVEQNLRRLVGRSRDLGLALSVDEDFDELFVLHSETHERKGAPLYLEREPFRRYYEALRASGLCHLFHARLPDGRVAASQLVLVGHPVTHTVCAATSADLQNTGASAFLRWSVFEWLAEHGYTANDLTDATLGSVSRFKSQLGAELTMSLVASKPLSSAFRAQTAAYGLLKAARRR